jgi:hypothetical protein
MISGEDHLARLNAPPLAGDTGPVLKTGSSCFWGFVFSVWPPNQSTQRCATFPLFLIRVNEGRKSCLSGNLRFFGGFRASPSSRLNHSRRQRGEVSALLTEAVHGAWTSAASTGAPLIGFRATIAAGTASGLAP